MNLYLLFRVQLVLFSDRRRVCHGDHISGIGCIGDDDHIFLPGDFGERLQFSEADGDRNLIIQRGSVAHFCSGNLLAFR